MTESPHLCQPFGVGTLLPITITSHGVRAGELVALSAGGMRVMSSRSRFHHLRGLSKAIAAHTAETGQKVQTFSAPPVSKFASLTGLAKAIAAHRAAQTTNPKKQ